MKARAQAIYFCFFLCLVFGLIIAVPNTPGWGIQAFEKGLPDNIYAQSTGFSSGQTCEIPPSNKLACIGEPTSNCSIFTISKGDQVFFGGNDDYINLDSYYWVDPGGETTYGVVWTGTPDNVQQGVNEMGLAYDANGLPEVILNAHPERIPYSGGITGDQIHILRECATVKCAIEWAKNHAWHPVMNGQEHFADASGDAVIIGPGPDGELAFTRKPPGDGFLVSTNFNVANPSHGDYPCWRYETMQGMLAELVDQDGELSVQDATGVLDAVHVEGGASWTRNSLVADLPNKIVYLYYFHQFDKPIVINILEEIENPRDPGPLSKLFPADVQGEAARRYQRIQIKSSTCQQIGMVWIGAVLASLAILLIFAIKNRRGLLFWVPVVVLLGPLGLLVWLFTGRKPISGTWQSAVVEAAGDVMPTVVVLVIMLVLIISVPAAQSLGDHLFLLFIFGMPLLVGLLLFQGPLLAVGTKRGYLRTVLQRLPQAWVAANLGMAGIVAIAAPLTNQSMSICTIFPLPVPLWTVGTWWAVTASGAILGWLLLVLYEGWAVRRGFRAWSVLASGEDELVSPHWRVIWWWIILSWVFLLAGTLVSVVLLP